MTVTYLAVDLGASSGRVMAAWLEDRLLRLEEIHRFENNPIKNGSALCWNFDGLMAEISKGLARGISHAREQGRPVSTIGIDSWAVDFGLVGAADQLVGNVVHYRDARTEGQMKNVFAQLSREAIFDITGIQFLPFNTIYQMAALKESQSDELARAQHFMMIADLVAWHLTGQITCEYTNATTTQLFDARRNEWSDEIISILGLPRKIFSPPVKPGETIGALRPNLAAAWGAPDVKVVAVATHDTGSAVAAVPAAGKQFAYLSSGTWSLLGTELSGPLLSEAALAGNFTNEGGAFNTIRFLKNIMGLWIVQECRRQWIAEGKDADWGSLEKLGREADDTGIMIDVDDARFLPPGDMPARVRQYCMDKGKPLQDGDGAVVRCVLKSLAQRYYDVLKSLENITGRGFDALNIVGGGIQNRLLCEWTAVAIGRPVIAGPIEATALGNIGVQMIAAGELTDLAELRKRIAASFPVDRYEPAGLKA